MLKSRATVHNVAPEHAMAYARDGIRPHAITPTTHASNSTPTFTTGALEEVASMKGASSGENGFIAHDAVVYLYCARADREVSHVFRGNCVFQLSNVVLQMYNAGFQLRDADKRTFHCLSTNGVPNQERLHALIKSCHFLVFKFLT
jgi:hypothetical protein